MGRHRQSIISEDFRLSLFRFARINRFAVSVALAASLGGCAVFADAPHYRGNAVSAHDLNELTPGLSSQADVTGSMSRK
jgi:hypothetical protein